MRVAASFRHAILTTSFTITSGGARIRSFYGGDPSFTSLMLRDFNLANEKTFKLGLSYDCGLIGLAGLSGFVNYAHGFDAKNSTTGASLPDDEETDLTLDIRPNHSLFPRSRLRLCMAVLNPGDDRRRVVQARVVFTRAFQQLNIQELMDVRIQRPK